MRDLMRSASSFHVGAERNRAMVGGGRVQNALFFTAYLLQLAAARGTVDARCIAHFHSEFSGVTSSCGAIVTLENRKKGAQVVSLTSPPRLLAQSGLGRAPSGNVASLSISLGELVVPEVPEAPGRGCATSTSHGCAATRRRPDDGKRRRTNPCR